MTAVGTDDSLVKSALLQVLQDKTDVEFDVVSFVQHVLSFSPQDIPRRRDGYHVNEEHCKQFSSRTYSKDDGPQQQVIKGEVACCHAFQAIVWDLIGQLQPIGKEDTRSFPTRLMFLQDHPVDGDFASYKPDFVQGPPVGLRQHKWEFTGSCAEMKKTRPNQAPGMLVITNERLREVTVVLNVIFAY